MFKLAIALLVATVSAVTRSIRGTNIGGWLVLEPWISPSLFYQFLMKEKDPNYENIGMDSYTFCTALGDDANRWMRAHWDNFITEQVFKDLAARSIERIRLPIGDWTVNPYGPYKGCMDGAAEIVDRALDWAAKYNMTVLIDVHTAIGSQNGFDNGGRGTLTTWTNSTDFVHWPQQQMEWLTQGDFHDPNRGNWNFAHMKWSIDQAEALLKRFGNHSAVIGYEPVNEPSHLTSVALKEFYREVRKLVQRYAPQAYFVFHDSFDQDYEAWKDLFVEEDRHMVAVDHHGYLAWTMNATVEEYCTEWAQNVTGADPWVEAGYEVWWGEWSLATDTCAHWLGGFQDGKTNITEWPGNVTCNPVPCPKSYMPDDFKTDFDREVEWPFPRGAGIMDQVSVNKGMCWDDSLHFNHTQVQAISKCIMDEFDKHNIKVNFMWTARNEIEERWSYIGAWDAGFINLTAVNQTSLMNSRSYRATYATHEEAEDGEMKLAFLQ